MAKKIVSSDQLITEIIQGIEEVKGENITILDLRELDNTISEYFIICDGTSNTQVNAIAGSIQKIVGKNAQEKPWHVEGDELSEWVLVDYVSVVVHIFQKQIRDFYALEELWGDAKITKIESKYK